MESLIFFGEKQDGSNKSRACTNGSTQHEYIFKDEAAIATVFTEAVMIRCKARKIYGNRRHPNAFVQAAIDHREGQDQITMKIKGHLIEILNEASPETCNKYITIEN